METKKIRIMFVCYGNICRSPMAEFMKKKLVKDKGEQDSFIIASSATSTEELGNPVHRGTRAVLDKYGISYAGKYAVRLRADDYDKYDYFIGMDENNRITMKRMLGGDPDGKVSLLLDYTDDPRDVADPWWTGDFRATEQDVLSGTEALYKFFKKDKKIF